MLRRYRSLVVFLGALALLAAQAPATVAAPAPTGMGWTVIDRYGGDANGDGLIDEPTELRPAGVNTFAVRVLPSAAVCAELERATWRVDGESAEPKEIETGADCSAVLWVEGEGEHTIKVLARNRAEVARVEVEDKLIVALGDSVASGEGNPEGNGPDRWLDAPCHRSAAAGFQQAANQLGKVDRRRSITFVSLACSGARIDKGLLGSYVGIEPAPGKASYLAQVDRLGKIDRRRQADGGPGVDAVLLSVGANDVNFGALARFCMLVRDCPSRRFDPEHPLREAPASFPTAAEVERAALRRLQAGYDRLAVRLARTVAPARTIVVEYFDPLRDANGDVCLHALPGLDLTEAQWAERQVLAPLDAALATAAARHGWQVVGGVATAFRRHGICAGRAAWVADPLHSLAAELALVGTLHPNRAGHVATATLIAPVLAATLGLGPGSVPGTPSRSGWVPWPWLLVAAALGAAAALLIRRMVRSR